MHDIALLKKLNNEQLAFVIQNDPCIMFGSRLSVVIMVDSLKELGVKNDTIAELIRSMGSQLAAHNYGKIAFDYLLFADSLYITKTAYEYAMQALRPDLLNQVKDAEWFDFLHIGNDATKAGKFDVAWKAYGFAIKLARATPVKKPKMINHKLTQARPHERFILKALRRLQIASLKHFDLDVYLVTTELLDAQGIRICSEHLQKLIALAFCNHVDEIEHNSIFQNVLLPVLKTVEKPTLRDKCMEKVAREGAYDLLEKLATLWDLTIPDRYLRLVLGTIWPKDEEKSDDNSVKMDDAQKSKTRLKILRELSGRSAKNAERYKSMLRRELTIAIDYAFDDGLVWEAHELATEAKIPLTLSELTILVREFAGRVSYDKQEIPYAIELMTSIVAKEKRKK